MPGQRVSALAFCAAAEAPIAVSARLAPVRQAAGRDALSSFGERWKRSLCHVTIALMLPGSTAANIRS